MRLKKIIKAILNDSDEGMEYISKCVTIAWILVPHYLFLFFLYLYLINNYFYPQKTQETYTDLTFGSVKAKKLMAFEVTKLVHGEEEALKAQEIAKNLFENKQGISENMPTEEIENFRKALLIFFVF